MDAPQHRSTRGLLGWVVRLLDVGLDLPVLLPGHVDQLLLLPHQVDWSRWRGRIEVAVVARSVQSPAVLGQLHDLPVWTHGAVVLLLLPRDVVTGVVGADAKLHVRVILGKNSISSHVILFKPYLTTFGEMNLNSLHGDLMRRVVGAGDGGLPGKKTHDSWYEAG